MGLLDELKKDWGTEEKRRYNLKLVALGFVLIGVFLVWEHLWTWGYLEFELFGHETLGLLLFLVGILLGWLLRPKRRRKLGQMSRRG